MHRKDSSHMIIIKREEGKERGRETILGKEAGSPSWAVPQQRR